MSKIDEILKNEKVEWRKLGEVFKSRTGYTPSKSNSEFWKDGKIDWFTIDDIRQNGRVLCNSKLKISEKGVKGELFKANSIVLSTIASIGEYALIKTNFVINQQFMVFMLNDEFKKSINMDYIRYYFSKVSDFCKRNKRISNVPTVDGDRILNLLIPIPSIETQEKIVEILDKYTNYVTELQAKLQAELQFRTKQYEYYRDILLSEDYLNKISKKIYKFENNKYKITTVELGSIVEIKNGKDWKSLSTGTIPVYGSGGNMGIYVDKYAYNKPTVLIPRKGSIENIFYLEEPFWNVDTIFYTQIDEGKIIPKYFYYFMQNYDLKSLSTDSTRPSLTQQIVNKIKIKLPPIEIQNKVVKVLDKFQALLEDTKGLLPTEIEQRRKQYEYYREKLLTFDTDCGSQSVSQLISNSFFRILAEAADFVGVDINNNIDWKTLGSIGSFENGKGMPKTLFDEQGSVGAIHYGHIYTKYNKFVVEPIVKVSYENSSKLKKVKQGDLVIAKTSENLDDVMKTVAYIGIEDVVTGGHTAIFRHKENARYLAYVLNGTNYVRRQKDKMARGVKVIELSTSDMEKIKIPLPSIPVQEHIVSILDKFDTLVNDIKNGLPKEIELRQKQYEYFREKLLNFSK